MNRYWIPLLFTIGNLASGVASLLMTFSGHYERAAWLILAAAMFDVVDGGVARWLRACSAIGKEMDSLADIISFGVAPAMLLFVPVEGGFHWSGQAAAVVFVVCGGLRLARFNCQPSSVTFTGLPITAAGMLLTGFTLWADRLHISVSFIVCGLLSLLMISRFRFPSLKNLPSQLNLGRKNRQEQFIK